MYFIAIQGFINIFKGELCRVSLGLEVNIPVLCDSTDISSGHLFLSDLEQTKGFEFDLMIVLNCCRGVIPHPHLPEQEWFRDLCKLYVALTRAKTELIVSYSGEASVFLIESGQCFSPGEWTEYGLIPKSRVAIKWPSASIAIAGNLDAWDIRGKDFLKLRDAVGLSTAAQDAILKAVTGVHKNVSRPGGTQKQTEWKTFRDFFTSIQSPRVAVGVISNEALEELNFRYKVFLQDWNNNAKVPQKLVVDSFIKPDGKENSLETNASLDLLAAVENFAEEGAVLVFKNSSSSAYSTNVHSAYMLAVLCVAQAATSPKYLTVGKPMDKSLLEFLLRYEAIDSWVQARWLRLHRGSKSQIILTKTGLDECAWRTSFIVDLKDHERNKLRVTEQAVESFRQTIFQGPNFSNHECDFSHKYFVI